MRWLGRLGRLVGWLLTPLVAWAASFFGAWLVLALAGRMGAPRGVLAAVLAVGFITAVVALLLWMWLLRHSARLRHTLHVDREGLPVTEELEVKEKSPEKVVEPAQGPAA